ncbi:3-hydroxyacyl-CoA dehydrogenase family protein [Microbacterium sp. CPCC 204701]|uniref:3-hydroxyacyl-CoA dehydrogenase family protein n=1 Tax=Microbacterium sp. CPCC 204701 TaxID=2493084 RepID=UPI000FD97035|nr:3-hydroxybutyryl-CoA dehydrogenase [Microbacterium sp. CPCC 204701]
MFDRVGVIGLGLMGSGIAEVAATAGCQVVAIEFDQSRLARGTGRIDASLEKALARGRIDSSAVDAARGRIRGATDLNALADCDLIIEAATELLDAKLAIFRTLGAVSRPDAVLASNTSSIPLTDLAAVADRPERVVGLHFFNPAPVMALVEVVSAVQTDPAIADAVADFARNRLGKTPIVSPDRAGFVVNALLIPYLLSAFRMLDSGRATAEDIDTGMRLGCGHPLGPLELSDFVGLDVVAAAAESMHREYADDAYAVPPLLRRLVGSGRLGRKSGRGVLDYQ